LGNVGLTGEHRSYRGHQMMFHAGLLHVSQRSRLQACFDKLSFPMYREEKNFCCGTGRPEFVCRVNSSQNRHADISHNDVRKEVASCQHQCCAVRYCPYDFKIGRQQSTLCFEQSPMIIG